MDGFEKFWAEYSVAENIRNLDEWQLSLVKMVAKQFYEVGYTDGFDIGWEEAKDQYQQWSY